MGPATVCEWQPGWEELAPIERAGKLARQGVRYLTLEGLQTATSNEPFCFGCMTGNYPV